MKGRMSKSPMGDVGSLLWRRRLATLAAKELKNIIMSMHATYEVCQLWFKSNDQG